MLYPALADHLARTSLAATSSLSRASTTILGSLFDTPLGAGMYPLSSILVVALSVIQAHRLARTSLAAISSSSRTSATVLVSLGETLPGAGRPSRPHVPRRDIQLLALVRDGTGSVGRCSTRRWYADHLARTSLAATSSLSRASTTILGSLLDTPLGAGLPSRPHVPRRDIQLLALVRDGTGIVWRGSARPWPTVSLARPSPRHPTPLVPPRWYW
ncbi:hypothetical protein AURDEDRAFT_176988 [Auricularia subglabra TFB-10046 SS5]|uniref:Uncharacterized protein n=1 Tax=Auricularia subglabra (strain TFB-10046 / SS5) TaxID=717982 RepID=J0D5C8_AURST|nr:hypothetical protein AURDEDRAFT_176988 [Auricularia subglabra TFB-10046 SS5]